MSLSPTDAPLYTDIAGLDALKRGAAHQDPAAIRKVAQQFEALFTRMMLKSMRAAVGPDPMFGSTQQQTYQEMADDQLSVQLARGRGLGLADMLVRQLQKMGVPGASGAVIPESSAMGATSGSAGSAGSAGAVQSGAGAGVSVSGTGTLDRSSLAMSARAAAYASTQQDSLAVQQGAGAPLAAEMARQDFIRNLWPHAEQAGQQLGVDPRSLIAQAALETNWGRNVPQVSAGRSSHNLFGVKASGDWSGPAVSATTQEFAGGTATTTTAPFRVYGSASQSFQDYVGLLRGSPRYSGALDTGSDVQAFASGLQRGGYATDPDYARKIGLIAQHVTGTVTAAVTDLKSRSAMPLTMANGTLSRR